jgi:DNA polymerase V
MAAPIALVDCNNFYASAAATVQGGLFDRPDNARAQACMFAMDELNARYGRDTVTFAATGTRRAWKLKSEFISPRYSTSWSELLCVQ